VIRSEDLCQMRSGLYLSAVGETSVGRPAAFAVIGDLGFAH
jgi:hypothetical protein